MSVRAVLVGIQEYDKIESAPPGPYQAVFDIALWLSLQGVKAESIHLFTSPSQSQEAQSAVGLSVQEPSFDVLNKFLFEQLPSLAAGNELLFLFWAGHGVTVAGGDRLFLCKDFSEALQNYCVSLTDLCEQLSSTAYARFSRQLLLFDSCASKATIKRSPVASEITWARRDRHIFCAAEEGEYAYSRDGHGVFSSHLISYLNHGASLTDLQDFSNGLRNVLDSHQERYYECYYRSNQKATITESSKSRPKRENVRYLSPWYIISDLLKVQLDCGATPQLFYEPDASRKRDGLFTIKVRIVAVAFSQALTLMGVALTYSAMDLECWGRDALVSIKGESILLDISAKRLLAPYEICATQSYELEITRVFQPASETLAPFQCSTGVATIVLSLKTTSKPTSTFRTVRLSLRISRQYGIGSDIEQDLSASGSPA